MKSFYERENVTVYNGDCVAILPQLPAASAQAIITSPPYNVGKAYEQGKTTADYIAMLHGFIDGCAHVLDCGGWMIINTADIACGTTERDNVNPVLPLIDSYAISKGFTLYDRRIWQKDPAWMTSQWHSSSPKSIEEFEYIFIYKKTGTPKLVDYFRNRFAETMKANGLKDTDVNSIFGFSRAARHWREDDMPTPDQWSQIVEKYPCFDFETAWYIVTHYGRPIRQRLLDKEWTEWGSRGVWQIRSVRANNDHPAKFPLELPSRLIRLFTWEGDTVIDPFMGSGTTAKAAEIHGRKFVGIEQEKKYCKVALKNLQQASLLAFQHSMHPTGAGGG